MVHRTRALKLRCHAWACSDCEASGRPSSTTATARRGPGPAVHFLLRRGPGRLLPACQLHANRGTKDHKLSSRPACKIMGTAPVPHAHEGTNLDPSCRRCESRAQRTQHVTPGWEEEWEVVYRTDCACPHQEQSMSVSVLFSLSALASHRATTPPPLPRSQCGLGFRRRVAEASQQFGRSNTPCERSCFQCVIWSVDLRWTDMHLAAWH